MMSVPVQSLKPGRTLAADVKNAHGQLLIKKGAEVSERHLRVLKSWGIAEIQVEGDPDEQSENPGEAVEYYDPVILEKARLEVLEHMRFNSIEHPAIDELVRICVRRRAQEMILTATVPASKPQ